MFGRHNLSNLAGAKWICQQMGVDEADFYEAMMSFRGAAKRLELLAKTTDSYVFKDFAHSPSKVMATTRAVREQFPGHHLVVCLELHTYSSLNAGFLKEYRQSLDAADRPLVFYVPESLAIKGLEAIHPEDIQKAFGRSDLEVYTETPGLREFLRNLPMEKTVLLFMSSGNYGGLNLEEYCSGLK